MRFQCILKSILHEKTTNELLVSVYTLLRACTVRDHAALPRMSANADFSTLLKCLVSGKKSIEQLRPSEPHTSEQCGKKFFVSYVRTYVLVLVLITPKSLPALILRVLASFVNSKTVHKLTVAACLYIIARPDSQFLCTHVYFFL